MLFDRNCPGCGCAARRVCARCWGALRPAPLVDVVGVDRIFGLYDYDERSRPIVLAAKNGGRRDVLVAFGRQLARQIGPIDVDIVTWVPASRDRRRTRGYDQGRVLARATARGLDLPHRRLMRRLDGDSQRGKGRAERNRGPILRCDRTIPARVLLIDDVITTGSSVRAATAALRAGGAAEIVVACVAVVSHPTSTPITTYCDPTNTYSEPARNPSERSLHGGNGQRSSHNGVGNTSAASGGKDRATRSISRWHGTC